MTTAKQGSPPRRAADGRLSHALVTRARRPLGPVVATERRSTAALVALGLLMLSAGALLLWRGRGLTFYFDEWAFIMLRREWSLDALLVPHNEHLHLTTALVFKTLFELVGLDHYVLYRATVVALHLVAAGLLFALARRRVGDVLAVVAVTPFLFLGAGWENTLWPFQVGLVSSLAAGLGALLAIERRDLAGDVLAMALLLVAFLSASLAVALSVVVLVELLWQPPRWRRLWVVAVPLALYAIWNVLYGRSELDRGNLGEVSRFAADMGATALASLVGFQGEDWGRPLLIIALLGLGVLVVRRGLPPRAAALLAGLAVFWGLTAVARAAIGGADASRYAYVGAVFLLLIAVEFARGVTVPPRVLALLGVVLAVSFVGNWGLMSSGLGHLRSYTGIVTASVTALELVGPETDPAYRPAPVHAPNIYAGMYFETIEELGSPAVTLDELVERPEEDRQAADRVYVEASAVEPRPAGEDETGAEPPPLDEAHWGPTSTSGGCLVFLPTAPGAAVDLIVPGTALIVIPEGNAHVDVHLRLFADTFPELATLLVQGAAAARIDLPAPVAGRTWHARLFTTERVRACTAAMS